MSEMRIHPFGTAGIYSSTYLPKTSPDYADAGENPIEFRFSNFYTAEEALEQC